MNVDFDPSLEAFREEVCAFLDTAPTDAIREALSPPERVS